MKIAIGISGASGIIYAKRLIEYLSSKNKYDLYVVASKNAINISKAELNVDLVDFFDSLNVKYFENDNFFTPIASGSFLVEKTIIIPCSVKTLAAIANGFSHNLITRICDVAIKEKKTLTICPREMPFSQLHLENMLKLSKIGVNIAPPIPAFYNLPQTIDDLINFVVGKVLDITGIDNDIYKRWE